MIKCGVIGASGYSGSELVRILTGHPNFSLEGIYVSANSQDAGKAISNLYPVHLGQCDLTLQALSDDQLANVGKQLDAVFLATPHEASHLWVPELAAQGCAVFDLSGAYRIKDTQVFAKAYGFEHEQPDALKQAVYGLAEWQAEAIQQADIIAVPGCYPTASLLALKPLFETGLLTGMDWPIINAVSGVSGAGRKATMTNSFCEVSLQAYGVLGHRHQPEIASHLGTQVIFTPHLGNFKRGILATVTVRVLAGTTAEQINEAYKQAYADADIVRLRDSWPKIDEVAGTPFCDLHWKLDEDSGYLVVTSAIDNLLKGAASQAVQCANIRFGLADNTGLLSTESSRLTGAAS